MYSLFFLQYDEVFDQMEATKVEQSGKKKVVDKKPKYITNLLKQAEIRNQEEERRKERKVQKEREAEGDEFADKEKFVTSAYRLVIFTEYLCGCE